jgi:UDP-N-acetylmuramate dehydrogenase
MPCLSLPKKNMEIFENYSLKNHNSFQLDASCRYFASCLVEEDLLQLIQTGSLINENVFLIGSGSNVLFTKDFDGLVVHYGFKSYDIISEENQYIDVKVGAGVVWDDFVSYCVENNWYGVENLSLIPGEVGACAVQNIGAYGVEICESILTVEGYDLLSGEKKNLAVKDCAYGYRDSIFKHALKGRFMITSVIFRLSKDKKFVLEYGDVKKELEKYPELNLDSVREVIIGIRNAKLPDPKVLGNAGSFFKNPVISSSQYMDLKAKYPEIPSYIIDDHTYKIPAGWLIEKSGWKGKSHGNAAVHEKQALVLVNKGDATGNEIWTLAQKIVESVKSQFNIEISPEVIVL